MEVMHTDAEGRLVLADVMSWTQSLHPNLTSMIELSTLTGAAVVALGEKTAALYSNNDQLAEDVAKAGSSVGEQFWRLPITEEIRESLKAKHCDLTNINKSRYGGAIEGAAFLENFVSEKVTWAHLDIAGPAHTSKEEEVLQQGATGFGAATLMQYYSIKAGMSSH